ncbi:tetratricopeptide repeat-containing sensor histidine kinase [Ferruginibacter sp.]
MIYFKPVKYFFYRLLFTAVIFFCSNTICSQTISHTIDSLKKEILNIEQEDKNIKIYFAIADNFMEIDQYDSAQLWLNKISAVLPYKEPSLSSYFLSTRQAEVYYYNGLQRLGLQESERSLAIAKTLHDSLLLADAYNFIGLFYINLDSNRRAIPYFKKGINFTKQPPYPNNYLSLTKPHHLYGNMAEAYEKMGMYDSAVYLSRISLQLAMQIDWKRGVAVAYNNLGNAFLELNNADSSLNNYRMSSLATQQSGDFDVELLNYGGLAKAEDMLQKKEQAMQWLQQGFSLIKNKPSVNNLFADHFLDDAIFIYKKYNLASMLTMALEKKGELLQKRIKNNNLQMNVVLNAGLSNETRLLNLEVQQVKQQNEISNTRVYLLLAFLILGMGAFLLYRYKARQKLQIVQLQNKISQDLHDDVGSSLSSLQVYSTVASQLLESQPAKAKEMLEKIAVQSKILMENIGDIVWSMKPGNEQQIQLNAKIKNFVSDVLSAANINYAINIDDGAEALIKNITAKKNILLIIKEAVNNTVKYSNASDVAVSIKKIEEHICVQVADNGKGFDAAAEKIKGDGLSNMQKRTEELQGIFEITSSTGKGTTVSALLPIPIISDTA